MKKISIFLIITLLTISTFANGVVTYNDASTAEKSKTEGVFNFSFDSNFTLEDINKTAKYYTNYFTVTPVKTENGINVTIKIVEDNEMARRVVNRFFVSLEVKEVDVNGTMIPVEKFVTKFIMK
jgi:hypothetical protein